MGSDTSTDKTERHAQPETVARNEVIGTTATTLLSDQTTGDQRASSVAEVLIAARKLIEKPENWSADFTPGTRCAVVAIWEVVGSTRINQPAVVALSEFGPSWWDRWFSNSADAAIIKWNFRCSHQRVMRAFDAAISKATTSLPGSPVVTAQSNEEVVVP